MGQSFNSRPSDFQFRPFLLVPLCTHVYACASAKQERNTRPFTFLSIQAQGELRRKAENIEGESGERKSREMYFHYSFRSLRSFSPTFPFLFLCFISLPSAFITRPFVQIK